MGLLFIISVWMFVLGILVGRGTAPVRFDIQNIEKELTALKEALVKKEQQQFSIQTQDLEVNTAQGFYEALQDESGAVPEGEFKTQATSESPGRAGDRESQKAPAVAPADAQVPTAAKDTARVLQTTGAPENIPPGTGRFTVQVASSKDGAAVDRMVAKLKKRGYAAYRTTVDISGQGTWYRVRVGRFSTRTEARQVQERLKKSGYQPLVVKQQ
jgi:DedD protein